MRRTKVAIVGSVDKGRDIPYEPELTNSEDGERTAEMLGACLAIAGHGLIVYSAEAGYVERDVVRGYVNTGKARDESIHVVYPHDQPAAADFPERKTHEAVFALHPDRSSDWELSFYQSLAEADGIVLTGGGRSTLIAGIVARAFQIPLVAIPHFGASAKKVWASLVPGLDLPTQDGLDHMAQAPDEGVTGNWVASLKEQAEEHRRRRRRRSGTTWTIASFILLLAWVATLPLGAILLHYGDAGAAGGGAWREGIFLALLFLAPALAGASGASVRMGLVGAGEFGLLTVFLGAGAGVVAGGLYIASQIVGGASLCNFVWLLLAALIAFVGGLTFDRVFARLRKTNVLRTGLLTDDSLDQQQAQK
jgi:hypothetical protein